MEEASRKPYDVERGMPTLVDTRVDIAPDFSLVVSERHPVNGGKAVLALRHGDADQAVPHLKRELVTTMAHLRERCSRSTRTRARGTTD